MQYQNLSEQGWLALILLCAIISIQGLETIFVSNTWVKFLVSQIPKDSFLFSACGQFPGVFVRESCWFVCAQPDGARAEEGLFGHQELHCGQARDGGRKRKTGKAKKHHTLIIDSALTSVDSEVPGKTLHMIAILKASFMLMVIGYKSKNNTDSFYMLTIS